MIDGQSEPQVLRGVFIWVMRQLGCKSGNEVLGKNGLGKLQWRVEQGYDQLIAQLRNEMLLLSEGEELVDHCDHDVRHVISEVLIRLFLAELLYCFLNTSTAK
jgi:hypothetical protein